MKIEELASFTGCVFGCAIAPYPVNLRNIVENRLVKILIFEKISYYCCALTNQLWHGMNRNFAIRGCIEKLYYALPTIEGNKTWMWKYLIIQHTLLLIQYFHYNQLATPLGLSKRRFYLAQQTKPPQLLLPLCWKKIRHLSKFLSVGKKHGSRMELNLVSKRCIRIIRTLNLQLFVLQ